MFLLRHAKFNRVVSQIISLIENIEYARNISYDLVTFFYFNINIS